MVLEMRLLLFSQFRVLRRWFKAIKGLNSGTSALSNLLLTWPSLPSPAEMGIKKGLPSTSRADGTKSERRVQLLYKVVSEWTGERALLTGSLEYTCQWKIPVSYSWGGGGSLALIIQLFELYWSNFTNGSSFICLICNQAKLLLSKVLP